MKFFIKDFFSKCDQFTADLVTFTEEIFNGKLYFLCSVINDKSSCIDLLFNTTSKLLCDVGVEQTIFNKCQHNIIYGSLYLKIPLPSSYYKIVWDDKNTDPVCIQRAVSLVNWTDVFSKKVKV